MYLSFYIFCRSAVQYLFNDRAGIYSMKSCCSKKSKHLKRGTVHTFFEVFFSFSNVTFSLKLFNLLIHQEFERVCNVLLNYLFSQTKKDAGFVYCLKVKSIQNLLLNLKITTLDSKLIRIGQQLIILPPDLYNIIL